MRETARARVAWADYLALGPGRSLDKLLTQYHAQTGNPPTRRIATLKNWSRFFGWQSRLEGIAERAALATEAQLAEYRREIMETGFAQDYERVKALKEVASVLHGEVMERETRWLRDVKAIGSGENARMEEIERFNAAEVEQFRGLLDDIAKEKGERKQQSGLTVDGGLDLKHGVDDSAARYVADLIAAGILASAKAGG